MSATLVKDVSYLPLLVLDAPAAVRISEYVLATAFCAYDDLRHTFPSLQGGCIKQNEICRLDSNCSEARHTNRSRENGYDPGREAVGREEERPENQEPAQRPSA